MSSPSNDPLHIWVAQTCPRSGPKHVHQPGSGVFKSIQNNLGETFEVVRQAAKSQVDLVVFPEYWLQGIVEDREYLVHPARSLIEQLRSLAKETGVSICGTIVEPRDHHPTFQPSSDPFLTKEDASPENLPQPWIDYLERVYPEVFSTHEDDSSTPTKTREGYEKDTPHTSKHETSLRSERVEIMINVAYVFEGGTGEIVGRYEKRNLWISEREYLTTGDNDHEVFELKGIKMGLLICWDLAHPSAAAALAKQGVDIILAPTYWLATDSEPASLEFQPDHNYELDLIHSLCYARAFESETAVVMCNAGGPRGAGFASGSGVWLPFKGRLRGETVHFGRQSEEPERDPTLLSYKVELERLLKVARETYQIRQDWDRAVTERREDQKGAQGRCKAK